MHGRAVVSGFHLLHMLKQANGPFRMSLDLGMTFSEVKKSDGHFIFPDNQILSELKVQSAIKKHHPEDCFLVENGSLFYIYRFDGQNVYRLYEPRIDWPPTLWINGSMMHTVSISKPTDEAKEKVAQFGNLGNVLETCFGLGYVSIEMIRNGAYSVNSYEISKDVLDIANVNPWSASALTDKRISVSNSDVKDSIANIGDNTYDSIMHDPPNVKLAGELYSLKFYSELFRVLKYGGTLYHFVGGGRIP
ncbi:MAG: hypothetical protein QXN59_02390, partial [Candidatus Micrarchaeaceae archaeon]